jgi:hypothetical protein
LKHPPKIPGVTPPPKKFLGMPLLLTYNTYDKYCGGVMFTATVTAVYSSVHVEVKYSLL